MKHIIKLRYFKCIPIVGFGYWREVYDRRRIGIEGVTHNLILPFLRVQWGYIVAEEEV